MVTRRKCPTGEHAYVEMASRSAIFCSKCGDIRETPVANALSGPRERDALDDYMDVYKWTGTKTVQPRRITVNNT
jgi:hypothetical protein